MNKTNAVPKKREEKIEMPQTSTQIHTPVIFTKPQVKANIHSQTKSIIIEEQPIHTPTDMNPHQTKKAIKIFLTPRIITQEALNLFTMGIKDYRQTRYANLTPHKFNIPHNMKDALNIEQFCASIIHPTTCERIHRYQKLQRNPKL